MGGGGSFNSGGRGGNNRGRSLCVKRSVTVLGAC
jgi:hypothetical protein